jgi:membrane-bound metal-dependent hydrolase YbcI (DUF457 family)
MDGATHAATGFLAGLAVTLPLTYCSHQSGAPLAEHLGRDFLSGLAAGAFALLPDADHPQASFARSADFISRGVSGFIAAVSGGHRNGMHSFAFGVPLTALACAAACLWAPGLYPHLALGALLTLCVTAALVCTGFRKRGLRSLAYGLAFSAAAVHWIGPDLWWLAVLGMTVHIAEDETTGHGCALLWPLYPKRIGGDGKQPAQRRKPRSGFRQAAEDAGLADPKTPRPKSSPGWQEVTPPGARVPRAAKAAVGYHPLTWHAVCGDCLAGECGGCSDKDCRCPQKRAPHPLRPGRSKPALVTTPAPPEDEAGLDDIPPY